VVVTAAAGCPLGSRGRGLLKHLGVQRGRHAPASAPRLALG
jgi:hypothetical protein